MPTRRFWSSLATVVVLLVVVWPVQTNAFDFTITPPNPVIKIPGVSDFVAPTDLTPCPEAEAIGADGCLTIPWISQYIAGLYKFAELAPTIVATVVMMIGGYLWLTAAGNVERVSSARGYIGGALTGLVLMLGSYTILNLINPKLVTFEGLKIPVIKKVPLDEISQAIRGGSSLMLIDCARGTITTTISGAYDQTFNQAGTTYGVDPFLILAVAKTENGTFDPTRTDDSGASDSFGLMQILPTTAQSIIDRSSHFQNTVPSSCRQPILNPNYTGPGSPRYLYQQECRNFLGQHPEIQVQMGAAYLSYIQNILGQRGQQYRNDLALVAAAYNQGEGNAIKMINDLATDQVQTAARNYFQKVSGNYRSFCPPGGGTAPVPVPLPPPGS